jgi:hypothetical protein
MYPTMMAFRLRRRTVVHVALAALCTKSLLIALIGALAIGPAILKGQGRS